MIGKKTLIIGEMLCENMTNGVSRYVEMLLDGLSRHSFNIIYLKFVHFERIALPKQIAHDCYTEIVIPLPLNQSAIIDGTYWCTEYNKLVEHIIEPYLTDGFIFHIQTLNLIEMAVLLRQKYRCKIVSHIHCIPWKYCYSKNQQMFNQIFYRLNIEKSANEKFISKFATRNEYDIIKESDAVICVTHSAKEYYEKYFGAQPEKIFCIHNGIRDEQSMSSSCDVHSVVQKADNTTQILYVGNISRDKGFQFVLSALRKVHDAGHKFVLLAAGKIDGDIKKMIDRDYSDIDIRLLGHIKYSELQKYYQSSQIGLISSLFEQCSYVALEMSMYGLPVVYSDIDELNEIFDRNENMHIPVTFSIHSSLNLDVNEFASKIIKLMQSPALRSKVGKNEHDRFIKYFKQEKMVENTIYVYNSLYQK